MRPIEVFRSDVPEPYLRSLTAAVIQSYQRADELCNATFSCPIVRSNSYPFVRRGLIEDSLLAIAAEPRFEGVVGVRQAASGSFWNHVETTIRRVVITQNSAADAECHLRPAVYKSDLAKATQLLLWDEEREEAGFGSIFSHLSHGKNGGADGRPGFVVIRFPKANLNEFYDGTIDLLAEFPELLLPELPPVEEIPEPTLPDIHPTQGYGA